MKKILLLNPPIANSFKFIRSGYCNSVSKSGYYWSPIDLLAQSGILKQKFEIFILDATAEYLDSAATIKRLTKLQKKNAITEFSGLLFISSLASKNFDFEFVKQLKELVIIKKILVSAGFLLFHNADVLKNNAFINGVLLDYTSTETIDFFDDIEKQYSDISTAKNIKTIDNTEKNNTFEYPTPEHLKFPLTKYYMPNCLELPMTNIITNLGCPFKCDFCTWAQLKYRQRKINNFLEELEYLKANNIRELMFIDPTFGANKNHCFELLEKMINIQTKNFKFSFSIECRVDLIDEKFAKTLAAAGCHSITFGLESGSAEILKKNNKNFDIQTAKNAFAICRKFGIAPTAHFIIGLPGETEKTVNETIKFSLELPADFASFNIIMPLPGTNLFSKIYENDYSNINTCSDVSKPIDKICANLTAEQIKEYSKLAFKKFYLRPKYLAYSLKKFCQRPAFRKIIFNELKFALQKKFF